MKLMCALICGLLLLSSASAQNPPPVETQEVKTLERFVGVYEIGPGRTVTITRQANKLFAQLNNGQLNELTAESAIRYVAPGGAVNFMIDTKGEVSGLVLEFNGAEMPATRLPAR
jgi:hypothetical protein